MREHSIDLPTRTGFMAQSEEPVKKYYGAVEKISKTRGIFGHFALLCPNMGPHMGFLGSDHVIACAAVTHPCLPRHLKNMLLGSNNTQMI